jgi:hypothetical protein
MPAAYTQTMDSRWSGNCDERLLRTPACLEGTHEKCGHFHGYGMAFNPRRLRIETFTNLCGCDCHASCPLTSEQDTVSPQDWHHSCTCPGAEAQRRTHDELGIELPARDDISEKWAKSRQESRSQHEAWKAARASGSGKNREQRKDLYVAELRARGLAIPSDELLDVAVDAQMGNYLTGARLLGREVVNLGKVLGSFRHPREDHDPR